MSELADKLAEALNADRKAGGTPDDDEEFGAVGASHDQEGDPGEGDGAGDEIAAKATDDKASDQDASDDASDDDDDQDVQAKDDATDDGNDDDADDQEKDDTWLKDVSERARKRFATVTHENKELKSQLEARNQEYEEVVAAGRQMWELMTEARVNGEELSMFFELNRLGRSGDLKAAQELWNKMATRVQAEYGFGAPEFNVDDALQDFPDLRQRVDDLDLSEDAALEIARLRRAQQQVGQSQAQAQQQQEMQAIHQQAAQAMADWEKQVQSNDPDFSVLQPRLIEYLGALQQQGVDPRQWVPLVEAQYKRDRALISQVAGDRARQPRGGVRPTGKRTGSGNREYKSMADALHAEFLRGRAGEV